MESFFGIGVLIDAMTIGIAFVIGFVCWLLLNTFAAMVVFMSVVGKLMISLAISLGPLGVICYPFMPSLAGNIVSFAMTGMGVGIVSMFMIKASGLALEAAAGALKKVAESDPNAGTMSADNPNLSVMIAVLIIMGFLLYLGFQIPSWASSLFGGASFNLPKGKMVGNAASPAVAAAGKAAGGYLKGKASALKDGVVNRMKGGGSGAPMPSATPGLSAPGKDAIEGSFKRI